MSRELTFVLEPDIGRVTVEISNSSKCSIADFERDLGRGANVNCGKPASLRGISSKAPRDATTGNDTPKSNFSLWLYKLYHDSVVDGPGRRSVVQVSGCSIGCHGCYVPQTHRRENGNLVSVSTIVKEIVANRANHDGVTILGGEPFDQPGPVSELVFRLRQRGFHITVYSGYTFEDLIRRKIPSVDYVLANIDLLIDGPFQIEHGQNAGEYRGSRNQRFIGNATML